VIGNKSVDNVITPRWSGTKSFFQEGHFINWGGCSPHFWWQYYAPWFW